MSEDEQEGSGAAVALAFFLGGLLGAGLALFLAPKAGRETREMVKELGTQVKEKVTPLADEMRKRVEQTMGEVRKRVEESLEEGREFVDRQKAIVAAAVDAGKEAVQRERQRLTGEK